LFIFGEQELLIDEKIRTISSETFLASDVQVREEMVELMK
jgi:hypothetical protein